MRIAIDIRILNGPNTGDRTVALGLVKGLAGLAEAEDLELALIARDPPPEGLLPDHPALALHLAPLLRGHNWMLFTFPRACRAVRADVAVIQYRGPFRSPCPFVTFIHDVVWRTMPETFRRRGTRTLNRFIPGTVKRAAAVLTGSEFARGEVARHYPAAAGKLHVVPYAPDERYRPVADPAELARVRTQYGLPEHYVLSVGLLQPRKNLPGLLEAHGLLPPQIQDRYPLVITGPRGWKMDEFMATTERARERVILTGYVPDEDLPALYTMASCLVYPSFYEGFGLPPLEAMACGTPVITSHAASLPEVTAGAALLVDPHRSGEISEAMARMLADESLRSELATRGLARAAQLNWTDSARHVLQVLRAVTT
ncbi:MAG: glycosyltransferase family 4 protein [Armatimonadetes bacterium]|nr:glycosyltransferase family 4 protein [Armatimonadota bacterium]